MKIIDCFMYFNEDLVLDVRLNELNQYIDKFVIVESTFTQAHNASANRVRTELPLPRLLLNRHPILCGRVHPLFRHDCLPSLSQHLFHETSLHLRTSACQSTMRMCAVAASRSNAVCHGMLTWAALPDCTSCSKLACGVCVVAGQGDDVIKYIARISMKVR